MFGKVDAERIFSQYGFNDSLKNDETIERTAKAFSKNEYTVANGPKGRNRLNSGILRNQFILLLDSLNGRPLNDYAFSGVSLLHDDQYVLVHQNENGDVWEVYQGNTPNSPRKIYEAVTLQSFFDDVVKSKEKENSFIFELPKNDETIEDRKTDFIFWLSQNSKGRTEFQKHVVDVLEKWLDAKIPNANIGNLFRFEKSADYEIEKNRISAMPTWDDVNEKDSNGRPRTALNHYLNFLKEFEREEPNTSSPRQQNSPSFTPAQVIYYGVPGCGKSNKIKESLKDVSDERKERVVFHPEYTNADFVGQILPVVHDGVDYRFTPGPFTKMIAKAYKSLASENPEEFFLVIEEINRGNAAAIFGDVFQLLDRIKPGETDSSLGNGSVYTEGWSQYFVYNEDVNSKILELVGMSEFKMGSVNFTKDSGIRLPPNLSILATMNTSDQNVSTLDNAFQRRFDMELVHNEFEKDESGEFKTAAIKAQHDAVIEGTSCTWGAFWENINKKIIQYNRGLASTEDKRLGPWFVCSVAGETGDGPRKIPAKTFTEKVLKYLWDDAFKFKRTQVFVDGLSSLEQVVSAFEKADGEKLKAVFKDF